MPFQKIDRPAIEVHNVDEVLRSPGRFAEVLAGRIKRVANRAVAVVDRVLAPDVALADMDELFREVAQVVGGEESGDHVFRPVAVADDFGNATQAVVEIAVHLLAGVVHVGEVSSGHEGDFITEFPMIAHDQFAQFAVAFACVVEGKPTEGPGNTRAGPGIFDGITKGAGLKLKCTEGTYGGAKTGFPEGPCRVLPGTVVESDSSGTESRRWRSILLRKNVIV